MSEIDLTAELSQKTLGALEALISQVNQGMVAPSEARVALRAVFDSVSGLVSNDCFDLITEFDALLKNGGLALHGEEIKLFVNEKGHVVRLSRRWGEPVVTFDTLPAGSTEWGKRSCKEFDSVNPYVDAFHYFNAAQGSLARQGYKELP